MSMHNSDQKSKRR